METGLWIFLIVYATLALADQYLGHKRINMPVFCLMIACMLLTRPEGLLFGLLLIALLFAMTWREQDLRSALRTSALPFAAYLVTAIGIILWRLSYFGYPFPNTYYAKVSGSLTDNMLEGMQYLVKFFYQFPHLAIIVAALFVQSTLLISKMLKQKSTKSLMLPEKAQAILLSVVFIGLLVPVLTGGDHFYYSRFYQPVIPLAIAASLNFPLWKKYVGKIHLRGRWFDKVLALLLSFGLFFISQSTWIDLREFQSNGSERIFQDFKIAKEGRQIAKKLNETFVEKALVPSVGIIAAGGFGYAYEGSTIDLMGLNNTIMAHANKRKSGPRNHASFDINGFWKLRPDIVGPFYGAQVVRSPSNFILPENRRGFSGSFPYKVYKGIFNSPDFVNSYKPALIKSKADHEYLFAYYHNNFLNSLDTAEYDILVLNRKTDPDQNKERQ
jgi:arabinofuranosyltransferase